MTYLSRQLLLLSLTATLASGIQAQDTSHPWTLQECIDYALANNLEVKSRQIALNQADVNIDASEGALFPSLSFGTNHNLSWRPWSEQYVNITDGTLTTTSSEVNYNGTYGLNAQWTVWNGGRNRKQLQRSRLARKQSESEVESAKLSIQEEIMQAYVQILYQTEAVEVNRQILASTQVQLQRAEEMYAVGSMSKADLAQMQAQASQQQYNVTNSETQLKSFQLKLKQLLEIVGPEEIQVAVPNISDDNVGQPLPSVASVYDHALTSRPEILSDRLGIQLADMDISIAKRGYLPTIGMTAGINTSHTSGVDRSFGNQLKTNLSNMLGLNLSVPIFDNRSNSTNVAKARLDKETAQIALAQQEKNLYSDIETYWLNASNAQQQYEYARVNAQSMRESYELVSEQFAVGLKDIVDLTTGKNNLLQAEQQLLQSKYTAVLNRSLLNFYGGMPLSLDYE